MSTVVYKCPKCDAAITYNAKNGNFSCDFCMSSFTEQEVKDAWEKQLKTKEAAGNTSFSDTENTQSSKDPEENKKPESDSSEQFGTDANMYNCSQCGATLITEATTSATFCSFCHNPAIISTRLSGIFKPSKVIPFKIDKKTANDSFLSYLKGRPFLPKDFKQVAKRDKLSGIYTPFWLFDSHINVDLLAHAQKDTTYTSGKYRITDHAHYNIERSAGMDFENLPVDASVKMDDNLMSLIEPYNYAEMVDFNMSYLSGFLAEKYDEDEKTVFPRAKKRFDSYGEKLTRDTIYGYTSVNVTSKNVNLSGTKSQYALLPVWIMNYKYKKKDYMFAINGQSGRMVGKLPISFARMTAWFFGCFGALSILFLLGRFLAK